MSIRLAAVAMGVVAAIALGLGTALFLKPPDPSPGGCPIELSEAHAVDTFVPGLTPAQRAWGVAGGTPGDIRAGLIAAFAWDSLTGPQSVVTIDPASGVRCRLVRFVENKPIRANLTRLDWSPSGDALAMGIENPQREDEEQSAQVLIWTPNGLFRVWAGPGQIPGLEWAPDSRSIAVWMPGGDASGSARIVFADGSPDREFGIQPSGTRGLKWSPDGSRWVVGQSSFAPRRTWTTVVDVADGRHTPMELGFDHLSPVAWLDDGRVLLNTFNRDKPQDGYLDVPLAAPDSHSAISLPEGALMNPDLFLVISPDRRRVAYFTADGDLEIAELAAPPGAGPIRVELGAGYAPGPAWAPDGSQLTFAKQLPGPEGSATYAFWAVNADGTGLRQVIEGGLWTMDDPWQPVPVE